LFSEFHFKKFKSKKVTTKTKILGEPRNFLGAQRIFSQCTENFFSVHREIFLSAPRIFQLCKFWTKRVKKKEKCAIYFDQKREKERKLRTRRKKGVKNGTILGKCSWQCCMPR